MVLGVACGVGFALCFAFLFLCASVGVVVEVAGTCVGGHVVVCSTSTSTGLGSPAPSPKLFPPLLFRLIPDLPRAGSVAAGEAGGAGGTLPDGL